MRTKPAHGARKALRTLTTLGVLAGAAVLLLLMTRKDVPMETRVSPTKAIPNIGGSAGSASSEAQATAPLENHDITSYLVTSQSAVSEVSCSLAPGEEWELPFEPVIIRLGNDFGPERLELGSVVTVTDWGPNIGTTRARPTRVANVSSHEVYVRAGRLEPSVTRLLEPEDQFFFPGMTIARVHGVGTTTLDYDHGVSVRDAELAGIQVCFF